MAETGAEARVLLDRYELRQQVGRGGMGEVWIGRDRRLQRDVAVKVLLAQLSDEPSFRERFAVEARAAAALEHPNVVNVYDIDEDEGLLFIVMERLPGPSLDRRLAEGPMAEDEVRRVAADMLAGLAAAHAHHLIHRDIKPGNLIRSAGGRWKVGDFGVAKDLASTAHLTLAGVAVGTPAYLAPEQLDGRPATPATDLWAAAVVLREALTGRRPFDGNDPIEVAHAVQHTRLAPMAMERPDIDPALAGALDRALSYDPAHRFTTATDMLAAIEGRLPVAAPLPLPAGPPGPGPDGPAMPMPTEDPAARASRRAWLIVAVVAVVALTVLAVLLGTAAFMEEERDQVPDQVPAGSVGPTSPTTAGTTASTNAAATTTEAGQPDRPAGEPPATTTAESDDTKPETEPEGTAGDPPAEEPGIGASARGSG
ncbi:MAG TPA: serine/threonine-protein kinase [Acidimicrobiales bacterium]|nr:serine/threonine-protein kinase [Acidimicrobiales bacterium]